MTAPLITPIPVPSVWKVLKYRLSPPPPDRAMVYLAADGDDRLQPPRRGDVWGYHRPSLRALLDGQYVSVAWVSLTERRTWVEVPAGPAEPSRSQTFRHLVAWKVRNPVLAARSRLTEDQALAEIVRHIGGQTAPAGLADPLTQPPPRYGTVPVMPPGRVQTIDDKGLVYWFLDPPRSLVTKEAADTGPTLPPVFGEAHREAYRFYREVVMGGPADLAAFWLLQHPEQARDVLDWTVQHRRLLTDQDSRGRTDPDGWEDTLARILRELTQDDRALVGLHLAGILNDLGIPQGGEVLERISQDASPSPASPEHNGHHPGYAAPGGDPR